MKNLKETLMESLDEGTSSLLEILETIQEEIDDNMPDWVHNVDVKQWSKKIDKAWKEDKKLFIPKQKPNFEDDADEDTYKRLRVSGGRLVSDIESAVKDAIKQLKELEKAIKKNEDVEEAASVWIQMLDDMITQAEELEEYSNEISKYYF